MSHSIWFKNEKKYTKKVHFFNVIMLEIIYTWELIDNDNENTLFDHNIQIYITDLQ